MLDYSLSYLGLNRIIVGVIILEAHFLHHDDFVLNRSCIANRVLGSYDFFFLEDSVSLPGRLITRTDSCGTFLLSGWRESWSSKMGLVASSLTVDLDAIRPGLRCNSHSLIGILRCDHRCLCGSFLMIVVLN